VVGYVVIDVVFVVGDLLVDTATYASIEQEARRFDVQAIITWGPVKTSWATTLAEELRATPVEYDETHRLLRHVGHRGGTAIFPSLPPPSSR
jgi:hypothetical protein